jgi:hypothetical protein
MVRTAKCAARRGRLPALLLLGGAHVVSAHEHIWTDGLTEANCTANYDEVLSSASRGVDDGDNGSSWVASAACFNLQMKNLALAGCWYFAESDCTKKCDASYEADTTTNYDGVDEFGNDEFGYCGLFCRNRDNSFGDDAWRLGCTSTAASCGCALSDCSADELSAVDGGGGTESEPPEWCFLYCDKVADSCTVADSAVGCAFAEAVASENGALVNITRVVSFSVPAANSTAADELPSLSGVCSTADESCNSTTTTGCSFEVRVR